MKLSSLLLLLTENTSFFPSVATLRSGDPLEGDLNFDPSMVGHEIECTGSHHRITIRAADKASSRPRLSHRSADVAQGR